jgi:hypothetical protein
MLPLNSGVNSLEEEMSQFHLDGIRLRGDA